MTDTTPPPQFWADAPQPAPAAPQSEFWKPSAVIGQGGTEAQARAFADEMVKQGAITREAADANLTAQGAEPAPADERSEEARTFDATFAPPPAKEDYKIDFQGRLPEGTAISTMAEFNSVSTDWLHEIGMPPSIGTSVIERALEVGQSAAGMSPPARELWKQEQRVLFDKLAKSPERAAQLRAYAETVLSGATRRADFSDGLRKSPGALHDASILIQLGLHGERLAARKTMR